MTSPSKKRIAAVDIPEAFAKHILEMVKTDYDFEFTQDYDADYVIHSIDGFDVLKYSGIRIFVTGENVTPDFRISDYAMGFDQLAFGDRHLWFPLIKLYDEAYAALTKTRPKATDRLNTKTEFCAYVMSNTKKSADERVQIFDLLSKYKPVHSGGRWRNNIGGPIKDKLAFQSKYKFVLALENCSSPGYLTEKFADAALADAIPIYWGDPNIGQTFNTKAFINCHDFESLDAVIQRVKEIDQNEVLYRQILEEPWFPDGVEPECLRDETLKKFIHNIFDQEPEKAYRRNRGRWGLKTEQQLYDMAHRPARHSLRLLKKKWHALRKSI